MRALGVRADSCPAGRAAPPPPPPNRVRRLADSNMFFADLFRIVCVHQHARMHAHVVGWRVGMQDKMDRAGSGPVMVKMDMAGHFSASDRCVRARGRPDS